MDEKAIEEFIGVCKVCDKELDKDEQSVLPRLNNNFKLDKR